MRIHPEGYLTLILVGGVLLMLNTVLSIWAPSSQFYIGFFSVIFFLFILQFFRNPERIVLVTDDTLVYAPADGKVVVIEKVREEEYFKDERLMISIFMSPFDVHVNRCPVGGKVVYSRYHPGKYLVAWHPKSSSENERHTMVIEGKFGTLLLRQIAGAVARRIVNPMKLEQEVRQGQEYGFIKFGSRVDIFLPVSAHVRTFIGHEVKANEDILARLL